MFTLGEKIRVINTSAEVVFRELDGTPVTAAASIAADADIIDINGYGKFFVEDITDIKMRRAVPRAVEVGTYLLVAPTGIAIGDIIEVRIFGRTSRYQSELQNNFIGAPRALTFGTAPLTGITITDIGAAIAAAWLTFVNAFNMGDFPIASIVNAAGTLTVTVATGYESYTIARIDILRTQQGLAPQPITPTTQTITTIGTEGAGLGKFLEESIRMSTWANENPFGIDNRDSQIDLRGSYTEISFTISKPYTENLSTLAADHGPLPAFHRFVIFMNENSIAANSAIHLFAAQVVDLAASLASVIVTVDATPDEELEGLIINDGTSVATAAAFIA